MKNLKYVYRLVLFSGLMFGGALHAQTESSNAPFQFGGFDNRGEATAAYRFTTVHGYRPQFQQMFDLQSGFRVQDLSLFGQAHDKTGSFIDRYDFTANGLGGDPFSSAQLKVSKTGVFDLKVNWRQSHYYWNQNDDVVLPITAAAPALSRGLTNNHDLATVRKFGSADLTIHATRNLQFNFETGHTSNDGTVFTTRSLDFFSAPSFWASFARANPYYLYAPLQDTTDRVAAGFDYSRKFWSVHYRASYQIFDETMTLNQVATNQTSIDTVALSLTEPLTSLAWSQARRLTSPGSEFSFTGKLSDRITWRGSYIYYRYRGPATMDEAESGIAPGSTGALAPYAISESGRTKLSEPSHVAAQGFTFDIRPWWDIDVDYRYSRFTSNADSNQQSLFNGVTLSTGSENVVWRDGFSELQVGMSFRPFATLLIHPGIRLLKSDIETLENGIADQPRTRRTKTAQPELDFSYQPWRTLSVRGDFHHSTSGASYTAITPHTQTAGRFVVRYQPIARLSVEDSLKVSNSSLIDANFKNNVRSNSTMVNYAWNDRLSVFGGMTYDSYFAMGDIVYARGPAPLNNVLRNQEINRIWQAGVDVKPTRRTGVQVAGNYDRTTGAGQISGEPPAYGPIRWPLMTGTAYYSFPRVGKLSIDLQRTYYREELVAVNNFSANMLTIRWTRGF